MATSKVTFSNLFLKIDFFITPNFLSFFFQFQKISFKNEQSLMSNFCETRQISIFVYDLSKKNWVSFFE